MTEKYKNKLFSVLGDSISTLDGYSEPRDAAFYEGMQKFRANVFTPEDTWWGRVISALGGELLVNNSISGSTVTKHPSCTVPSYAASDERTSALGRGGVSPDVIMVFMGTNDRGYMMKTVPTLDTERDDLAVFSVAYRAMLEKLKRNYPNAEIWCLTLPVSTCTGNGDFAFPYRYSGVHIEEYCDVIRTASAALGCRTLDLYSAPTDERISPTPQTVPPYDTVDGIHPNADGMKTLADAILARL